MAKTKAPTAKPRRHQASLFDFWSKPESESADKGGNHGAKQQKENSPLHNRPEPVEPVSSKIASSGDTFNAISTPRPTTGSHAETVSVSPDDTSTDKQKVEAALTVEKSQVDPITTCSSPVTCEPTNDEDLDHHAAETTPANSPETLVDDSLFQNPAPEHPPKNGLSEYELLRLRNIQRNHARLEALGLGTTASMPHTKPKKKTWQAKKKRKASGDATSTIPRMPTRRSTRCRLPLEENDTRTVPVHKDQVQTEESHPREEQQQVLLEEEHFQVSPVVQYSMEQQQQDPSSSSSLSSFSFSSHPYIFHSWSSRSEEDSHQVKSLAIAPQRLASPKGLSAIYSMQWYASNDSTTNHASWLVGAGKSGMVALWDCQKITMEETTDPVLSWKAHGGRWIAHVQFWSAAEKTTTSSAPSRLVTAANDGTVCLWDLGKVSTATGAPQLIHRTGKELHTSGIFAMDVNTCANNMLLTGSKDKTVAVTALRESDSSAPIWRSNYHSSKVSAVQWRGPSTVLASTADDGLVCVHDYRIDSNANAGKPMVVLENAHDRPHSVVWDPCNSNVLLTGEFVL
jgi:WD40 repeat protein